MYIVATSPTRMASCFTYFIFVLLLSIFIKKRYATKHGNMENCNIFLMDFCRTHGFVVTFTWIWENVRKVFLWNFRVLFQRNHSRFFWPPMYHLYSPQKWPMEIGNHKWPLKSHCNPDERSEEGYNWCFWGHEWLPIPLVTIEDYTNTIVFISNHLWRTKMFLKNGKNCQGKLVKWQSHVKY